MLIRLEEESASYSVQKYIETIFRSAKLQDIHGKTVQYHLMDPNLKWGYMFRALKKAEDDCPIESFYITDTSIEQIFLSMGNSNSFARV